MPSFNLPGTPSLLTQPTLPAVPTIPGLPSLPSLPSSDPLSVPAVPGLPSLPALSSVPAIPGLPGLPGLPTLSATTQLQDVYVVGKRIKPTWGIYLADTETLLVKPDTILSIDYRRDWRLADYPIENGAFETYNKVPVPFDVKVRMTKGSLKPLPGASVDPAVSDFGRRDFLKALEAAAESLALYDVRTPDAGYYGVNIVSVDYRREASNGASLLTVEVGLREVRLTAVSTNVNVKEPAGAVPISSGTVQTKTPTTSQVSVVTNAIAAAKTAAGGVVSSVSQITSAQSAAIEAKISSGMRAAGLL